MTARSEGAARRDASTASGASTAAVEVRAAVKRYGGHRAVDGLDLTVHRGEILALLGPNGAGKTTTVEMIEGIRHPDSGNIRVLGLDPRADRAQLRKRMGVMLQEGELQSQIKVREALELFAAFYPSPLEPRDLMAQLGVDRLAERRYRGLSGGERQRLNLALALVGRPEIAILDEPTAAMDADARRTSWRMLRELRDGGATVLLTTHLIEEAEALADRVAIMDRGRLVAAGPPRELVAAARPGGEHLREVRLELALPDGDEPSDDLRRLPGVIAVRVDRPGVYTLTTTTPGELHVQLATWLWAAGLEPAVIRFGRETLEELFLRLTAEHRQGPDGPAQAAATGDRATPQGSA